MNNSYRPFIKIWRLLVAGVLLALLFPVGIGVIRLFLVIAIPLSWLGALFILRRRRRLLAVTTLIGMIIIALLTLPGRTIDRSQLRDLYVRHLSGYVGAFYLLGGENRLAVDCSGLVRRALADANLHLGITTLNPAAIRQALYLWLHDSSANALGAGYLNLTLPVMDAESISRLDHSGIFPGDLAVSQDGQHVLAYLGDNTWIQADPDAMRVTKSLVAEHNRWFTVPVRVVRWSQLALDD